MTATRPVLFSVLTVVSSVALKSWGWLHCRTDRRDLRGPVRGVLTGHPWADGTGVQSKQWTRTSELSQFLTSRRAKVTPEQAGLPTYGQRRVPGLRREEVASLAGVSVEYYKRLERGNATGASDAVLDALADALRLDDAERAHLFDLARAASPIAARRRRRPVQQRVRPVVQRILDSIDAPATVSNMRCDYLAANQLGPRALLAAVREPRAAAQQRTLHLPRPGRSRRSSSTGRRRPRTSWQPYARWPAATPTTAPLSDLVGELSTRSDAFRTWWAAHNVRYHQTGTKRLHHPVVGDLELSYEVMELAADTDYDWRSSPPNPAAAPRRPSTSSPAGPPHPTSCPTSIRPPTTRGARDPAPHPEA